MSVARIHPPLKMAAFLSILTLGGINGFFMRGAIVLSFLFLAIPCFGRAATAVVDRPVARIDGLVATVKGSRIVVEANGAVMGGGWKHAMLKPVKSTLPEDAHTIVLEFVAEPPPANEAVIPGLLPVKASIRLRRRRGVVSVRAVSAVNEITTQILK